MNPFGKSSEIGYHGKVITQRLFMPSADIHATRLSTALIQLGQAIRSSTCESQSMMAVERMAKEHLAAEKLDAWLWLWETQDGPGTAAQQGDAWLLSIMKPMMFNWRVVSKDPLFIIRPGSAPLGTTGPSADVPASSFSEIVARYAATWDTKASAPHVCDLEVFQLPLLTLMSQWSGIQAPDLDSVFSTHEFNHPLGLLVSHEDLALTRWWLDRFPISPDLLTSYAVDTYNPTPLLMDALSDKAWVSLWIEKGISPEGNPNSPVSQSPLFQTKSKAVLQFLLDAGVDPDRRDEYGTLPEERRESKYGSGNLNTVHECCQEARKRLGRNKAMAVAHARHQLTLLAIGETSSDPAFEKSIKRGPWPTWDGEHKTIGLLEYLARSHTPKGDDALRKLCKNRLSMKAEFRRRHHDDLPDWAIAHAISGGLAPQPLATGSVVESPLVPHDFITADMGDLLNAWVKYGSDRPAGDASLWAFKGQMVNLIGAEHVPAVCALVDRYLSEALDFAPPNTLKTSELAWKVAGSLSLITWEKATDPQDRQALWTIAMLHPTLSKASVSSDIRGWLEASHARAWEAGTPELWRHLAQSQAWKAWGEASTDQAAYLAHIRSVKVEDVSNTANLSRPRHRC